MDLKKNKAERKKQGKRSALLLGLGMDGKDGHVRITSGPEFHLVGGSKETHELMPRPVPALQIPSGHTFWITAHDDAFGKVLQRETEQHETHIASGPTHFGHRWRTRSRPLNEDGRAKLRTRGSLMRISRQPEILSRLPECSRVVQPRRRLCGCVADTL